MVRYFYEEVSFRIPFPRKTVRWIRNAINQEGYKLDALNIIFCEDRFLANLNKKYLDHNTFTDIITFDYSKENNVVNGELYISVPRVKENATKFNVSIDIEIYRVIIHGILHLMGYSDKTPAMKQEMRNKEDSYLSLRS